MSLADEFAIVVVPGFHVPSLTTNLLLMASADPVLSQVPVFSAHQTRAAVLSPYSLRQEIDRWWQRQAHPLNQPKLLVWAFSAGCIGAVGLAHDWQYHRGQVLGLWAVDGWGVPLPADYPVYRLSHDRFTDVTSSWLGSGNVSFYADPPVPHLELWNGITTIDGWQVYRQDGGQQRLTAGEFICHWSRHHLARALNQA
jgi:hypothetical protein